MRHDGEDRLIARSRRGDRDAYDGLMAIHERRVYHLCLRLLGDTDAAVEAAQDVFVEAWKAVARFRGDSAFSTWIHSIAVFTCRQAIRRRRRERARGEYSMDDPRRLERGERTLSETLVDPSPPPDRGSESSETAARVRRAVAELPLVFREAVVLRELEGMSYDEAAAALHVRVGTLKSRLHRAKRDLVAILRRMEARRERVP